jgi:aminopeptidase YwaD
MKRNVWSLICVVCLAALLGAGLSGCWTKKASPVNVEAVLKNVQYLSSDAEFQDLTYRTAGMEGEAKAAQAIQQAFEQQGLVVEKQAFDFIEVTREDQNEVVFSYEGGAEIHPTTSEIVASEAVDLTLRGKLIDLGKGARQDYAAKKDQLAGNFVLMEFDESTSVDDFSVLRFGKAVKGILVYDPNFTPPSEPVIANKFGLEKSRLFGENVMTVTTLSKEDFTNLKAALQTGTELVLSEQVKYAIKKEVRHSQNIVATRKGSGNQVERPLVVVGAHYDSVNDPGADDNASGAAALMGLAEVVSNKSFAYDLQLVAFGAEEVGLFGSNAFVSNLSEADLKRCKLMINLDGPGIGNVLVIGKSSGEADGLPARELAFQLAQKNQILYKKLEFPDSDQFNFSRAGIPTITFASLTSLNKNLPYSLDPEFHTFMDLQKEEIIIPEGNHSLNDTYERVAESNKTNANFEKLFTVLLGVLEAKSLY